MAGSITFLAYGQTVTLKLTKIDDSTDWSELTIKEAGELVELAKSRLPQVVQKIYSLRYEQRTEEIDQQIQKLSEGIDDEMLLKILPAFYGDCLALLSDIKPETLAKMNQVERTVMFTRFIEIPLMGLLNFPDFQPKGIKSFTFQDVEYYLPSEADGYGVSVPMGDDTTAIEFIESADIEMRAKSMSKGRWDQAALLIAILCRPKIDDIRERYDEKKARQRAKIFEDLPMNVALEVFFCFIELLDTSKTIGQIYMKEGAESLEGGQSSTVGRVLPMY